MNRLAGLVVFAISSLVVSPAWSQANGEHSSTDAAATAEAPPRPGAEPADGTPPATAVPDSGDRGQAAEINPYATSLIVPADAQNSGPRNLLGIAAGVGTLGLGLQATYVLNRHFTGRAQINGFHYSHGVVYEDTPYQADFKFLSFGLLGDWYPLAGIPVAGKLRFTAGAYANFTRIGLNAPCLETGCHISVLYITAPGIPGTPPGELNGELKFNKFSPYAGFGVGQTLPGGRLHISFDLGVLFQGKPKFHLTATGTGTVHDSTNPDPNYHPTVDLSNIYVQENLYDDRQGIQDRVNHFQFYPVIALSVGYWFKW